MPKVHKGMVPPLFSGATGGENNPKTNSNLTWGYLKKKRHDVLNQYKVLLLVKVTWKLINIPFLSLSHYLFHSVLVKNTEQELWDRCGDQIQQAQNLLVFQEAILKMQCPKEAMENVKA